MLVPPSFCVLFQATFRVEGNATPVTLKISSGTEQPIHVHLTESAAEEERTKKALLAKDKALLNGKS